MEINAPNYNEQDILKTKKPNNLNKTKQIPLFFQQMPSTLILSFQESLNNISKSILDRSQLQVEV